MKIISLIENTSASEDIKSEHGLSLYIEANGKQMLFDMGQTGDFAENAERLGVDLAKIDLGIISHGHYDHGGGLRKFLKLNDRAPVYINKKATLPYYNGERYIGLDTELFGDGRLIFLEGEKRIGDGLTLMTLDAEPTDAGNMRVRSGDRFLPDRFDHEQYLLIEEGNKRVLISGCSHKGILQILRSFNPDVMVGGMHLINMPLDEGLTVLAKEIGHLGCQIYTCHCTGKEQFEYIKKYIDRIEYLSAGDRIEI